MIQQMDPLNQVIVAHRGLSAWYPENTRRAFDEAVACGADAIECDIQVTSDGHIVICHNPTLESYGYPATEICTSTLACLQSLDVGHSFGRQFSGERLLTLEELLQDFGTRIPLQIEFKTKHMAAVQINALVDDFLRLTAMCLETWNLHGLCFDKAVLRRLHETASWLPLVWNTNEPQLIQPAELAGQPWLSAVGCRIAHLTEPTARMIHDAGLQLFSFTCNDEADVVRARSLGVDFVITDDPVKTRQILSGVNEAASVSASSLSADQSNSPATQ